MDWKTEPIGVSRVTWRGIWHLPTDVADVLLSTRRAQYAPSRWGTRLGQRATWCNRVKAATRCFAADCRTKNVPTTEDWAASADGYSRRWQFPNCLGAVNGKHVAIAAPPKSGSLFYNYKVQCLPGHLQLSLAQLSRLLGLLQKLDDAIKPSIV
ncbi:uncharacterized protein LOC144152261 isoform X2 [Haemaphysalis longicornis]